MKRSFLILFLALPALCYGINWVDQAADGDPNFSSFHNPANWNPSQSPGGQQCWIYMPNLGSPVVDQNETIEYLVLGNTQKLGSCQLYIAGGELSTATDKHFYIGHNSGGVGVLNVDEGKVLAPGLGRFLIGNHGTGTFNLSGNAQAEAYTIIVGSESGSTGYLNISEDGYVVSRDWSIIGRNGEGTLHMTGGTFYGVEKRLIVAPWWNTPQGGHIQLDGGVINVDDFEMGPAGEGNIGTMDVEEGKLIIRGRDKVVILEDIAAEGRLTGYGGSGHLNIVFDGENTVVSANIYDPKQAKNPQPGNNALSKNNSPLLKWQEGVGSLSHDIYLGSDFNDVNMSARPRGDYTGDGCVNFDDIDLLTSLWLKQDALFPYDTTEDRKINIEDYADMALSWSECATDQYIVNVDSNSYRLSGLEFGQDYYWRVDELDANKPNKGQIWHFKTPSPVGFWEIYPDELVSGTQEDIKLRYKNGDEPIEAGSYFTVLVEPLSVKSLFHCKPSVDFELTAFDRPLPNIDLDVEPTHGIGYTEITFTFPDGLDPGDSFSLRMGNEDHVGNITGLVNPVPVTDLTFETYSDLGEGEFSWYDKGWASALGRVDIIAASASKLRIFGPSLVEAGTLFDVKISVVDEFDSGAYPVYAGQISLTSNGVSNLPTNVNFVSEDENSLKISGLSTNSAGTYRITAYLPGAGYFESNPIVVRNSVEAPVYWGNIHNHGWYSECWGDSLDVFYSFARDISGMDFVSLSDHLGRKPQAAGNMGRLLRWRLNRFVSQTEAWEDTIEKANLYDNPPEFVTLIGYEWADPEAGHYNIYQANATIEHMDEIFEDTNVDISVMKNKLSSTDVLFIPHIHAGNFAYEYLDADIQNINGEPLTPVIEIYSDWGDAFSPYGTYDIDSLFGGIRPSSGRSYLWAIDNGYKIGMISDSDSHTGLPGRRNPGGIAPHHDHPQGLTAVRTNDYSRTGIMQAYRDRVTYGTTGERIFVDVSVNGQGIGEDVQVSGSFTVDVEVAGTEVIESVSLYKGLTLIEKKNLGTSKDYNLTFNCSAPTSADSPYSILVMQEDENRAWTTPVWVSPN